MFHATGTVFYEGEWLEGEFHGQGKKFSSDGTVEEEGIFNHGHFDPDAKRKRKIQQVISEHRERVVKAHHDTPHVGDVPTCALCCEHLHHGDVSYVYVPCGHRVVCGECESSLDPSWRTRCVLCKTSASHLLRTY